MVTDRETTMRRTGLPLLAAAALLMQGPAPSAAQDGPPGIATPTVFAPYDPKAPACAAPPGLKRSLAFAKGWWPPPWTRPP
jgi:hypothetical protein